MTPKEGERRKLGMGKRRERGVRKWEESDREGVVTGVTVISPAIATL